MAAFRVMRDLKKRTRDLRRPQGQQTQKPGRCLLHHSRSGGFSDARYLPVLMQRGNTEDFAPADKPASWFPLGLHQPRGPGECGEGCAASQASSSPSLIPQRPGR